MQLFSAWADARSDRDTGRREQARRDIAAGETLFDSAPVQISNVRGLNDNAALGSPSTLTGTCTTCHDTPNTGNHSFPCRLISVRATACCRARKRMRTLPPGSPNSRCPTCPCTRSRAAPIRSIQANRNRSIRPIRQGAHHGALQRLQSRQGPHPARTGGPRALLSQRRRRRSQ